MTDLDNTQIIPADESLLENSPSTETEASLKIISGADARTYQIDKDTIIGRSTPSDVIVSASSLSKQHARISISNGQYFITDLASSNKTFHNKIQLQPNVCYALHDGDEIKLGDIICSFHEEKQRKTNDHKLCEPAPPMYEPAVNTLVEDDSPWHVDNDLSPPVIVETNADVIPSTQPITDSYDDEEPTQPMKIWNGNSDRISRLSRTSIKSSDDVSAKSNGSHEPSPNKSSSFVPAASFLPQEEPDDGSLVIGSSLLPATVPLLIEPTQLSNNGQLEIVSSTTQKESNVEEEDTSNGVTVETASSIPVYMENTQAYSLEPMDAPAGADAVEFEETQAYSLETTDEEAPSNDEICNTQPYELEHETIITDIVETKRKEVHELVVTDDTMIEKVTTTVTTTTKTVIESDYVQTETLAYDLQSGDEPAHEDIPVPVIFADTQAYDLDEEIDPSPPSMTHDASPSPTRQEPVVDTIYADDANDVSLEPLATSEVADQHKNTNDAAITFSSTDAMIVDDSEEMGLEVSSTTTVPDKNESKTTEIMNGSTAPQDEPSLSSTLDTEEQDQDEELEEEESATGPSHAPRGVPRKNARRARGRRVAGARARVVTKRLHGGRRNPVPPSTIDNDATLEETINTDSEEPPMQSTAASELEQKPSAAESKIDTTAVTANGTSTVRVSARIKARASSGRNRQFPYADDYVDLDDLEKQSKLSNVASITPAAVPANAGRKSNRSGRGSATPQKRISLRQQPIDASESPDEGDLKKQKSHHDVYDQMDTGGENEEPDLSITNKAAGRKRKSATPTPSAATKRTRSAIPQTTPTIGTRGKQTSNVEQSSSNGTTTPKPSRKSSKIVAPLDASSLDAQTTSTDRPVRIALSSHLNFEPHYMDVLRKLGFEMLDESCQVDALVVDRIRRTKKFFMCLARGAHILSPAWIEAMIKENRYVPYDNYYLEDTAAETRYGFQLRESVRLAKQHRIFENYKIFCTKGTSPPYEDLKDIVEAAGGKFIEKVNFSKPEKGLICVVAQSHRNEYEDLFKKGVLIVTEEFALSGISKQKLDFDTFSLFQNAPTVAKTNGHK